MNRWKHTIPCLLALAAFLVGSHAHANLVFDLADDFSLASNPNGTWAYRAGTTVLTGQTSPPSEIRWAVSSTNPPPPFWNRTTISPVGANDWQVGDVLGHSTNTPNEAALGLANVIWTAPEDGIIGITGRAWDAAHNAERNTDWSLTVDGVLVAELTTGVFGITRNDAAAQFSNNLLIGQTLEDIIIEAGDTIVFTLDAKGTTEAGHFVGTELTITYIPEPASLALLGLGGLLIGSRRTCSQRCKD